MHGKLDYFSNFNTSRIGLTLCGYAHMWGWEATFYTLPFRFLNTISCNFVSVCLRERESCGKNLLKLTKLTLIKTFVSL
jgi:hypothetical protein